MLYNELSNIKKAWKILATEDYLREFICPVSRIHLNVSNAIFWYLF